ncbi:MAG: acetate--CoA ligase family protein [Desulfomonilia bacterium]
MGYKTPERMRQFFSPENIAVVGASENNQWFFNMLGNASLLGFQGRFYPVNPRADEVCGIRAYRSIGSLPKGVIDFAVVMVKSTLVPDTVRDLHDQGINNILLISSGFAETGGDGLSLQREIQNFCRDNGILLMGPNCLGFMNFASKTSVFVGGSIEGKPVSGNIGVIGQSGASSEMIISKLLMKSCGVSLYVTTGNEASMTAEDCMDYLIHDPSTKVIAAFMEGFRDFGTLRSLATTAARKNIPIVLIKIGRSETGRKAAQSHTGALAGNDAIVDGVFQQLGIIRAESIEELVETASLFSRYDLPEGDRVGIYTLSGGLCGLYADLCDTYGIDLPPFQETTRTALKAHLPAFAAPDNPLDVTGAGFRAGLTHILELLIQDDNLDIILPLCIPPQGDLDAFAQSINEAFLSLAGTRRKLVIPITFREVSEFAKTYFSSRGITYIDQPGIGFKALSHMIRYASFVKRYQATENPD